MLSTGVIAIVGVLLLVATIVPGVRLWWPQRRDPVSRTDLGVALMTGALIAFAILALQLLVQVRSQRDANERADQADRQATLLLLGRSQNLAGLDLHKKDLTDAYLNGKVLDGAQLQDTPMGNASLEGTHLIGADLHGANLVHAQLERADLRYADLRGANLAGADLNGAKLDGAMLSHADLSGADLSNAYARADFDGATLVKARLVGTRLGPADLVGADLTGADLLLADLRGANLKGATLSTGTLSDAKDASFALFDSSTTWPKGYVWPIPDGPHPSCEAATCTLARSSAPIHDVPPQLASVRSRLQRTTRPSCLPGWWLGDQLRTTGVYAPRGGASFTAHAQSLDPGMTPKGFASSFGAVPHATTIKAVTAAPRSRGKPTAAFARVVTAGRTEEVEVYFIDAGVGFRLVAAAPTEVFPLFERDFIKLFRALGVRGDLFPSLRGDEASCRT